MEGAEADNLLQLQKEAATALEEGAEADKALLDSSDFAAKVDPEALVFRDEIDLALLHEVTQYICILVGFILLK